MFLVTVARLPGVPKCLPLPPGAACRLSFGVVSEALVNQDGTQDLVLGEDADRAMEGTYKFVPVSWNEPSLDALCAETRRSGAKESRAPCFSDTSENVQGRVFLFWKSSWLSAVSGEGVRVSFPFRRSTGLLPQGTSGPFEPLLTIWRSVGPCVLDRASAQQVRPGLCIVVGDDV